MLCIKLDCRFISPFIKNQPDYYACGLHSRYRVSQWSVRSRVSQIGKCGIYFIIFAVVILHGEKMEAINHVLADKMRRVKI